MNSKAAEDFLHSAVNYCRIIENFNSNQEKGKLKTLLVSLLDLCLKAFHLPDVEPGKSRKLNVSFPKFILDNTIIIGRYLTRIFLSNLCSKFIG